jgi:hypothetical protein
MAKSAKAAVINPVDDKLYIGRGDQQYLSRERKNFSFRDYVDEEVDVTTSNVSTYDITLNNVAGVSVGDVYYESSGKFAIITAVDIGNNIITVDVDLGFSVSTAKTFTVDSGTNVFTCAGHQYQTGLEVSVTSTGTLPSPLVSTHVVDGETVTKYYYVYKIDANTFKLCPSKSESLTGDNEIDITTTGSGTHTITPSITPEVRTAYRSTVEWNAVSLDSPAHLKQFYEANFLTSREIRSATAGFKTNLSGSWATIPFTGSPIGLWGLFSWGELPWGGDLDVVLDHRTYVPRDKQRCGVIYPRFVVDTAFADWELAGVELTYRNAGGREVPK